MRFLTRHSASWPTHWELHRMPQWQSSHAPPPPSTALRGPWGVSPKAPVAKYACGPRAEYSDSWPVGSAT
eukprot:3401991-Pyramimonas_sp.AAC.1